MASNLLKRAAAIQARKTPKSWRQMVTEKQFNEVMELLKEADPETPTITLAEAVIEEYKIELTPKHLAVVLHKLRTGKAHGKK